MLGYWTDKKSSSEKLRLLVSGQGWKSFKDKLADDGKTVESQGSGSLIESALLNTLNLLRQEREQIET
jgi:hypothetical protein